MVHVARRWAVNGRHRSRLGSEQRHRVQPSTVDCSTEDGELATAHLQRVTVFVVNFWIVERSGQYVRIVRTAGLHDCHETARRRKYLDPAVVTDDPIYANEDCPSGADRDAGVPWVESDDLIELVVAKALPCITKCGIDSEKRFTVGPEPTNVYPRIVHWSSVTVANAAYSPQERHCRRPR